MLVFLHEFLQLRGKASRARVVRVLNAFHSLRGGDQLPRFNKQVAALSYKRLFGGKNSFFPSRAAREISGVPIKHLGN